jgi:hypothetical protein
VGETAGALIFAVLGLVLLLNVGGIANVLARYGRRQEERWGRWLTAGTAKTPLAVRLLGVAFVVLGVGIAVFPPS